MRFESKRLTFWQAFWLFLAGLSLCLVGLLSITVFSVPYFPMRAVKVIVLAELLYILQAYLMARYWMRVQMRFRPCWRVTPAGVEVYDGERMLVSFPWRDVSDVTFRRGVLGLKLHFRELHAFFLKGITRREFEQVKAIRQAGVP